MLTKIKGKSTGYLDNIKALHNVSSEAKKNIDSLASITSQLDSFDIGYRIDISSARNFEYYTGLCFQLISRNKLLGAGGRYDNLIPLMGGENIPACGMALYVDELMKQLKLNKSSKERVAIVCPQNHNFDITALCDLTNTLYDSGYITEFGMKAKKESYNWIITISSSSNKLDLTDISSDKKHKAVTTKEIISILKRNI